MQNNTVAYCYRVRNYEQYLHDVGELRALGYSVDDWWNALIIKENPKFNVLYLHIDLVHHTVELYDHFAGTLIVPNLEYIINKLPVVK
ncbi:hypothetical protein Aristophanes_00006 [Acinetobacter phage Aristophanes]|uniref:Uncharacterized protein n=1 Tax=Acinetobacter phage Aristophanes TaxID=2759203 RepID=A0A7G9VYL5_BPACA|nr:hypothetical protein Aristophanes_00006 [Acinetobacter phage Aristophanes]